MSENLPVLTPQEKPEKKTKEPGKKKNVTLIISIAVLLQVFLAVFLGIWLFKRGYQNSKTNTETKIRKETYNTVYGISEDAYHTSNRAFIHLEDIQETANLEVLQIDTSYVYISDEQDKSRAQTIWYRINGTGTYTVNLQMAEFVVDNERQHVLVRAPYPVITNFKEGKAQELEYRDNRIFDGSIIEGEQTARKILVKAHNEMIKSLEDNQYYFEAAKDSSVRLITNTIKALNPDMKNLKVTVLFY